MAETIVVASGKGGTGKTMITANLGAILAGMGYKTAVIDMDTGLRNLDLYLGLENNVVYDVNDVLSGMCRIKQALIKDKTFPGLSFMAASPKPDSGEITPLHVKVLCSKLAESFDYILIDAPAGMEDGLSIALGGADRVLVVLSPEYASIRDAEAVSAIMKDGGIKNIYYILNRVDVEMINSGYAPSFGELPASIRSRVLGIIQEDRNIRISTNIGVPVVFKQDTYIYDSFRRIASRIVKL